jgi:hydrogenase expression/formation protein HypE
MTKPDKIILDHGSGGKISHHLTTDVILPTFDNPILACLDDGAVFAIGETRFAFSTDTYTVDPIFFPGGSIGDLAINGTVNDISMCGATPLYLSVGLILEEGFAISDLEKIMAEMGRAADRAGVRVVTGDTKVVPKGAADKIFINTSGIGTIPEGVDVSSKNARVGDRILLSGSLADHGVTILTQREGLTFDAPVKSDSAPLNYMVRQMFAAGSSIHTLRDPTRGGAGTALNEIARSSRVGIRIEETSIPVKPEVSGICELLGFDPLYLANEGKLIAFVGPDDAEAVLGAMQANEFGRDACMIGEVVAENPGQVFMQTRIGGQRIVDMLAGEQLPRIC